MKTRAHRRQYHVKRQITAVPIAHGQVTDVLSFGYKPVPLAREWERWPKRRVKERVREKLTSSIAGQGFKALADGDAARLVVDCEYGQLQSINDLSEPLPGAGFQLLAERLERQECASKLSTRKPRRRGRGHQLVGRVKKKIRCGGFR